MKPLFQKSPGLTRTIIVAFNHPGTAYLIGAAEAVLERFPGDLQIESAALD